jgi:hypothetical protein
MLLENSICILVFIVFLTIYETCCGIRNHNPNPYILIRRHANCFPNIIYHLIMDFDGDFLVKEIAPIIYNARSSLIYSIVE